MDATPCGRFKLAFKFKLFTISVSIPGSYETFQFLFGNSRTARHLLVRTLPNSSIRIHCIPSVAWDTRVEVEFFVEVKFFCKSSLIKWSIVLVHSSSNHPSSTRSSISSLYLS